MPPIPLPRPGGHDPGPTAALPADQAVPASPASAVQGGSDGTTGGSDAPGPFHGQPDPFFAAYGLRILLSLRRVIRHVGLHSRRLAAEHQITGPQLVCLTALIMEGPLTLGGLAARVSLSASTVNGIVDRLEDKGLVSRVRDRRDRRRVVITATGAGADRAAGALPLPERFVRRLRGIPEPEQAAIANSLERIVGLMGLDDLEEITGSDGSPAPK